MAKAQLTRRKRGRPRKRPLKEKRGTHYLDCRECGDSQIMPKSAKSYFCSNCVTKMMPAPKLRKMKTTGPKAKIRKMKLEARRAAADALLAGETPEKVKIPEMPRGWHLRKLFTFKIDGKTFYYVKGKEVSKEEYLKVKNDPGQQERKHEGYGRGWHLKKSFVAPDGTKYSYGKKVK